MKGTVVEYVENEVHQLTTERESLQKASRMLEEIKEFFGDFKLDSIETLMNPSSIMKNENDDFRNYRNKLMTASTTNLCTPVGQADYERNIVNSSTSDRPNLLSSLNSSRSMFSLPTTFQSERAKKEKYRQELLEQIRDKECRKAAQTKLDNALDAETERKVTRQQIMMQMDQLAERERGEFVTKNHRKVTGRNVQLSSYIPVNDFAGKRSSSKSNTHSIESAFENQTRDEEQRNAQKNDGETKATKSSKQIVMEYSKLESNILANLNEVRKIMQWDHVEMLEQLLNS